MQTQATRPHPLFTPLGEPGYPPVGTPYRWRLERATPTGWTALTDWQPDTQPHVTIPDAPGDYRIYAEAGTWEDVLALISAPCDSTSIAG